MNFKEWLKKDDLKAIIFLDLDQTLICHKNGEVEQRPHLREFIFKLKQIAPLCILTHGTTDQQKKVVRSLKLDVPVIGHDEYDKVHGLPQSILIDDKSDDWRTRAKLKAIGIKSDRLVKIKPWHGGEDNDLLELVTRIRELYNKKPDVPQRQPFKDYDKAKDLAKEREDKFEKMLKDAAEGHKVIINIKNENSFDNKTEERGKAPTKVFDVLRGAILVDTKDQIESVVKNLKKLLVKKIERKIKPEPPFGYYGPVHVDIVVDNMVCEVQVMTKKFWPYKLEAHKIYQKYRGKEVPKAEIEHCRKLYRLGNGD